MTLILLKIHIKGKILGYLQSKYNDADIDELLSVCTYLDPRFKESYIEGNSAIVKYQFAREGVEIIGQKICDVLN